MDVGARAAGLPAADDELRRVRLVPHRPIPADGPWRAAIRPRRGGDAGARAAARSTAPRPVVRRRHERRHLERPCGAASAAGATSSAAPSRSTSASTRSPASCRQRFSFRSRAWGEHAATPRCGFRSIRRRPTRAEAAGSPSRTPAANPGCRWNRRRRTPGESPPPSPPSSPHATGTTRPAWPTCARRRSGCSARASAPRC